MKKIIYLFLVIFTPQIMLVIYDKSWQVMMIFFACSIFLCLYDKISSFKLYSNGIEVKMQEAINEAYATIENIKELIDLLVNFNMQLMAGEDLAWEGTTSKERVIFLRKARKLAAEIGLDTAELRNSFAKAKAAVIYAFSIDISDIWGRSTGGYDVSNKIIKTSFHGNAVDLDEFDKQIEQLLDPNKKTEAQELRKRLVEFLDETRDIDDHYD